MLLSVQQYLLKLAMQAPVNISIVRITNNRFFIKMVSSTSTGITKARRHAGTIWNTKKKKAGKGKEDEQMQAIRPKQCTCIHQE